MYSLCASFLGRICLSGDVDKLEKRQEEVIKSGFTFYRKLSNVIKYGKTTVCGNRGRSVRHPDGVQIVVRKTDDEILVIYHGFKKSEGEFEIDIPSGYAVSDSFCADSARLTDGKLLIKDVKEYTAGALLLKR